MPEGRKIGDWIADRHQIHDIHDGGMGVVYVVYDHQGLPGQRVLAIKTLRDELLTDRRQRGRFVSECETWIKLERHPNIVRAFSVQDIDGKPHALLELVTGGDLRRWIGTPRLDLVQALRFGVQFCLGMEHAVRKGLHCHRDVKPENLLVTEGGTLKITDFGLAKVHDEAVGIDLGAPIPLADADAGADGSPFFRQEQRDRIDWNAPSSRGLNDCIELADWGEEIDPAVTADYQPRGPSTVVPASFQNVLSTMTWHGPAIPLAADSEADSRVSFNRLETAEFVPSPAFADETLDGAILGTAAYMAPEQFRNAKAVDMRADMYSFGVVLFEMIATRRPFRGNTYQKLARQHDRGVAPSVVRFISSRHSRVGRALDRIIQRCLAKDPSKRYATFFELRRELAKCLWAINRERIVIPAESELEAWELTNKGVSLGTLGRFDEERESYEESIRIKPDYAPAWFNQAAALGSIERPADAIEYANVALLLNPTSVPALINKALAFHALDRSETALALFDRAAHLQPREPEVWYGRGYVLLQLGNFEGAKSALNQALRLRPTYPEAILAMGIALSGESLDRKAETERLIGRAGGRSGVQVVAERVQEDRQTHPCPIPWLRRTEDSAVIVAAP